MPEENLQPNMSNEIEPEKKNYWKYMLLTNRKYYD